MTTVAQVLVLVLVLESEVLVLVLVLVLGTQVLVLVLGEKSLLTSLVSSVVSVLLQSCMRHALTAARETQKITPGTAKLALRPIAGRVQWHDSRAMIGRLLCSRFLVAHSVVMVTNVVHGYTGNSNKYLAD